MSDEPHPGLGPDAPRSGEAPATDTDLQPPQADEAPVATEQAAEAMEPDSESDSDAGSGGASALELESPRPGRMFQPLKATATRTERIDALGGDPAEERVDAEDPEDGPGRDDREDRTIQPLKATSTRTEAAAPEDATPLVVLEDDSGERPGLAPTTSPEKARAARGGEGDRSRSELLGEVRSLRSRNQILRAERTAIAGRKYALEVVIESLREKLEVVAGLCEGLDAPGELGEALKEIREVLGDARRIAESKAVLAADLEAERAQHLEERQRSEQKLSELNETVVGLRSERDALRDEASRLGRERAELLERVDALESSGEAAAELQARTRVLETERDEAAAQAAEAQAQIAGLGMQLDSANAERQDLLIQTTELADKVTALTDECNQVQALRIELEVERDAAQAELARALAERDAARSDASAERAQLDEQRSAAETHSGALEQARARLAELEATLASRDQVLAEQRKALVEVKPIVEDWSRLDSECQRLARLVGEARDRGRVNVQELIARAALLKQLEKLTAPPS